MLVHPSAIDLSSAHLRHLARRLAAHRRKIGTRWRRITPSRQALPVLAHLRHGMNVQVLTDPFGRPLRASPALPGSLHDLTAARTHGIVDALAEAGPKYWADKAHQGAGDSIPVPFRGRRPKRWQRGHNSTHAKIRCLGEQAMATLKGRRLPRKPRCSTNRITDLVKAVLVLHHASA
ncbi:transposase family protein [Streptomyces sp. NPDC002580]|uniref:transposase family protein n=1 Tax=Streptomyces sp. NPDC002580 TaxID=3364653 RepID=UPI0036B4F058